MLSLDELNTIAEKNKWLHSTDEITDDYDKNNEAFDYGVDKSDQSVNVNLFLLEENRKMKNELVLLRKEIERMKIKPQVKQDEKRPKKKEKTVTFEDEVSDMVNLLK